MTTVLVTGATGTVGGEVVRALVERRGVTVRALVRDPAKAKLPPGVAAVRGDLRDHRSVLRALEGATSAFYVSPHEDDEEALARGFASACETRGVRIVFVGVHADGSSRVARALKRFAYGRLMPHYRAKFRLSEAVRQSRTNAIVLMPTNFFQNDELAFGPLADGRYVVPIGTKGVNRIDVRDLGEAAARALVDADLASGAYPVVGPVSLTGPACAAVWSRELGRDVAFVDDFPAFEACAREQLSGRKLVDFVASHRVLRGFALPTDPRDLAATTALLGRAPRAYEQYVADRATAVLSGAPPWHGRSPKTSSTTSRAASRSS